MKIFCKRGRPSRRETLAVSAVLRSLLFKTPATGYTVFPFPFSLFPFPFTLYHPCSAVPSAFLSLSCPLVLPLLFEPLFSSSLSVSVHNSASTPSALLSPPTCYSSHFSPFPFSRFASQLPSLILVRHPLLNFFFLLSVPDLFYSTDVIAACIFYETNLEARARLCLSVHGVRPFVRLARRRKLTLHFPSHHQHLPCSAWQPILSSFSLILSHVCHIMFLGSKWKERIENTLNSYRFAIPR